MKILYTLNSSNYGGMEKTVLDLVSGLGADYEKFIICPKGDFEEEFQKYSKVIFHPKIGKFNLRYLLFLRNFLKKNKIDVIHANEPRIVFHSLLAGLLAGTRIRISHTHTPISMWQIGLVNKILNILMNTIVVNLFSTYEIALTNSIKKQKIKELILPFKLKVIPNCLDNTFIKLIDDYRPKEKTVISKLKLGNKYLFLYLSRFTREKNQNLLIEAFANFTKTNTEAVLLLAGKGEDLPKLKKKISALNLENRVFILTDISETDKIDLYMNANCFVFPSLAEGFGITLLEAMYSCYPVISSNLEVLREVSGNRVLFFKNNNLKSLSSKIKDAYKLSEDFKNKIKENKSFIKNNYSLEKYIGNYERLYQLK